MSLKSVHVALLRRVSVAVCLLTAAAFATNPVPTVTGPVQPQAVVPGSGAFMLTVYGAGFVSGAVVNWNGQARSTTFVSARELQAQILAADVAKPTAGYITVTNPAPGGGVSSSSYGLVEVHRPTKTIVSQRPHFYGSFQQGAVFSLIAADFNGDGTLDLAAGDGAGGLIVRLGNGKGAFYRGSVASSMYFPGGGIAFGDFNTDGKLDLVFSKGSEKYGPPTYDAVKLGNGKGGFKFGSQFGSFPFSTQLVTGDFNGDGKLDVAVAEGEPGMSVFLGNGDGTFSPGWTYFMYAWSALLADFNGDGKLDLAVQSQGSIDVLLGNGDGTFQNPVQLASFSGSCAFGPPILVNDFNGDGKFDLAFCNSSQIGILIGNGDGTFQAPIFYDAGTQGNFEFAAGDFNSDGKTDLIVSHDNDDKFFILRGNGDGTFPQRKMVKLPGPPSNGEGGIVTGDFNSDGLLDFVFQEGGFDIAVYLQK